MKLLFENWRKYLKESERPEPGHTKSRYEKCPENIAFDGFAKATYDATGESGGFLAEAEEDPMDLGFDVVTIEDLTNPFKYINRPDEKKYIILELFKAFRKMIDAIVSRDKKGIRSSLQTLETMSGGGLIFKDEKEAYSFYNEHDLNKVHKEFEKALKNLTKPIHFSK
jgi:hypothetical protein